MEEELVGYNVAQLAHKKGFYIETPFNYYNCPSYEKMQYGHGKYHDDELGYETINERYQWLLKNKPDRHIENKYSAPTQAFLQKWLRDLYNIHIEITPYFGEEFVFKGYSKMVYKTGKERINIMMAGLSEKENVCEFTKYENVLDSALYDGLQLIKI